MQASRGLQFILDSFGFQIIPFYPGLYLNQTTTPFSSRRCSGVYRFVANTVSFKTTELTTQSIMPFRRLDLLNPKRKGRKMKLSAFVQTFIFSDATCVLLSFSLNIRDAAVQLARLTKLLAMTKKGYSIAYCLPSTVGTREPWRNGHRCQRLL